MTAKPNVFISWSGDRSRSVGQALRSWLPKVIQAAKPWMSETDIDKGSRNLAEIEGALEGIKVGISCLTPENLEAPWLLFEAGALSKTVDDKTRLCTYLFGGVQPGDVKMPLGMFQATKAEKEDTRKLLHTLNGALSAEPIAAGDLDELFDSMWPKLERMLMAIPEPEKRVETKRSTDEIVAEILEWTRAETNRRAQAFDISQFEVPIDSGLSPLEQFARNCTLAELLRRVSDMDTLTPPMKVDPNFKTIFRRRNP